MWRARNTPCQQPSPRPPRVRDHEPAAVLVVLPAGRKESLATPDDVAKFIERSVSDVPGARREDARERMREGLAVDSANGDTAAIKQAWNLCEQASRKPSREEFDRQFDSGRAAFLGTLVCDATEHGKAVAKGIGRNFIPEQPPFSDFSAQLARRLLGQDGETCAATADLDRRDKKRLVRAAAAAPTAPAPGSAAAPTSDAK